MIPVRKIRQSEQQKNTGAYFTPADPVRALVKWAVKSDNDRMLDPSCGDGRFLALHHLTFKHGGIRYH